jgi:predicted SprT family Zn-dependent metalloprotease
MKKQTAPSAVKKATPSTIIVEDRRGSALVTKLERVWRMLRALHPEIPTAVIAVYSVPTRRPHQNGGVLLGHFSAASWLRRPGGKGHEIGINPHLFGNAKQVLITLLHEAAHAALHGDSNNGKTHSAGCSLTDPLYHRTEFRDLCKKWGIKCTSRNRRYGFCDTAWPKNKPPTRYVPVLRYLEENIPVGVRGLPRRARERQTHLLPLRCQCDDRSRVIFTKHLVVETGSAIRCDRCKALFQPSGSTSVVSQRVIRRETDNTANSSINRGCTD